MEWPAVNIAAAWPADNKRRGRAPSIVSLGNHVDDLVEGAADEVHELELGDRTHAGERRAESGADDGRLGNWCINNALRAEAVNETVGDFKRSAVDANVFAEAEDGGIAFHFFPDALADGFEIGELGHSVFKSRYFKCTAASVCFILAVGFARTFGIPYFGLISWHPFSQYTPPAADSGSGIGLATANSRSASSC